MPIPSSASNALPRQDLLGALYEVPLEFAPVGRILFPPLPVPKDKGTFGRIGRGELLKRTQNIERASGTPYKLVTRELTEDTYSLTDYGLKEAYDEADRENYDEQYDYLVAIMALLRRDVLLGEEIRVKDLCHDTTNFTGSTNTLAVTNEWDDAANAAPIDDVHAGILQVKNKCGMTPDTLQISWKAQFDLSRTDQIREAIKYVGRVEGVIPLSELAASLGVKRIVVPDYRYNSAADGQSAVLSEVWDQEYAFLCVTANGPSIKSPGIGRTFYHSKKSGLEFADEYFEDDEDSTFFRFRQRVQNKRMDTIYGFLFSNVAA